MTTTKSLLSVISALALAMGAAFAGQDSSQDAMNLNSEDTGYFAQTQPWMVDPMTEASTGPAFAGDSTSMPRSSLETTDEAYLIIEPVEVVEVESYLLVPSSDSELLLG